MPARSILISMTAGLSLFCQSTTGLAWNFVAAKENWGTACYAQHKQGKRKIGIQDGRLLLIAANRQPPGDELRIVLGIDGESYSSSKNSAFYFGGLYYTKINSSIIGKIAAGSTLKISLGSKQEFVFDLTGSHSAISRMQKCAKRR